MISKSCATRSMKHQRINCDFAMNARLFDLDFQLLDSAFTATILFNKSSMDSKA